MLVWEAHLSTVKASKKLLDFAFVSWVHSRSIAAGAKIGGWGNLERFLFGNVATVILHRNYGNTSIEFLLDVRVFICL